MNGRPPFTEEETCPRSQPGSQAPCSSGKEVGLAWAGLGSPGLAGPHPQPNQLPGWIPGSWHRPGPMQRCLRSKGGPSETLTSKAEIEPRVPACRHVSSCDFLPEEPGTSGMHWGRMVGQRGGVQKADMGQRGRSQAEDFPDPAGSCGGNGAADSYRPRSEDCSTVPTIV